MRNNWVRFGFALFLAGIPLAPTRGVKGAEPRDRTGPWDVQALYAAPKVVWHAGPVEEGIKALEYEGEPFNGKPTRVFAYYARPKGDGPFPAMVLVHGGGGKAFKEWAKLWADRGYAALAMDLAGCGPDGARLPNGGPDQSHPAKFRPFTDEEVGRMWTYHAVSAVIRGHSLLTELPEVDANRIGITGISWGGYLTCIVAGLDHRLKVAVPVYGCGFLNDNSAWLDEFAKMEPAQRQRWLTNFDPSQYLGQVRCPILFVNGTNDFAYPLDSYQKSYQLVPGPTDLCVTVRMPHGHPPGWAPPEIGLFVDQVLRQGVPLARVGMPAVSGDQASTRIESKEPLREGELAYTTDEGDWSKREWRTVKGTLEGKKLTATLPAKRPLVFFFLVRDGRGATTTSRHVILPKVSAD